MCHTYNMAGKVWESIRPELTVRRSGIMLHPDAVRSPQHSWNPIAGGIVKM